MESDRLVLWTDGFWISPYAFSTYVTLVEKALPFEAREVALDRKEQHAAGYQKSGLTGKVPRLDHGDFSIAESSAIVEYLDDAFPHTSRALPVDVRDRARARMIMAWVRSDLLAIREERGSDTMFYPERRGTPLSARGREQAERLLRVASDLVPDGKTTLFGPFTTADADLSFMLQRLILNGEPVAPKLRAFADATWARPSVRGFVERERRPYVPY